MKKLIVKLFSKNNKDNDCCDVEISEVKEESCCTK
ncbi:hypothetical protein J2Z82_001735 [Virgibacillus litoralis]|uniref:Uncharacterized protein n=1 Tax=Virgibacillus litoralis TaxID=578221 RepID=A0ABS4HD68_9BACI|nr:hypothetical protein [Virgibacillus litoralis]